MSENAQKHRIGVDTQLLELTSMVLADAGYSLEELVVDDVSIVLGESPDNIVVMTATVTVRELVAAESILSRFLVQRLSEASAGGKRWDAYVAVLTRQSADVQTSDTLFGLTYNLRHVRRLLKVGVDPTLAGVARALRALLPLPRVDSMTALNDPLDALAQQLVADGIDEEIVSRSIGHFRGTNVRSSGGLGGARDDNSSDPSREEQPDV